LLRSWLLILFCTLLSEPVAAQQAVRPSALSWRAAPRESCRAMILTNFGGYMESSTISGGAGLRVVADWGVLANVGARTAVGASFFSSYDGTDGFILGPAVRYRRWLSSSRSIDLGLGTPMYTSGYEGVFSPYGLIQYNPTPWVGLALRPELRRVTSTDFCKGNSCTRSRFVMSAGVEFGWVPGFALTAACGGVTLLTLLALAASGS
jgi:hypothetical protein